MDLLAHSLSFLMMLDQMIFTKIKNSPSLTLTKANGTYTVLCVAKGRPAPKLSLVHHPPATSFNVTRYVTTSPSGEEEQFTSKIEFLYTCTQGSFNRSVKCCDDSKLCTNRTLPSCQETNNTGVQHTPHGSTGGVTLDDTSSTSPTSMTTTFPSKAHTSLADRWETKQWLVPLTIVATIVGAVIVMVVIAFFISLTQSRASKQQGPLVNGVLQLGNNAVQERYEMNADEEDGPHDTAVYANVPAELTNAPNTQSSHTASLALGPDTACNALGPDTACNALGPDTACNALGPDGIGLFSEARSVVREGKTTITGEEKELTYIDIDFSENKQTPGPRNGLYQPVEYVMVDFTQTNTLKG